MKEITVFVQKTYQEVQFEPFSIALSSKITVKEEGIDEVYLEESEHLQRLIEVIIHKRQEEKAKASEIAYPRRTRGVSSIKDV